MLLSLARKVWHRDDRLEREHTVTEWGVATFQVRPGVLQCGTTLRASIAHVFELGSKPGSGK